MSAWQIILFIIVSALALYLLFARKKAAIAVAAVKKQGGSTLGKEIMAAAGQIPVYGQVVRAATPLLKPVNRALEKVNQGISTGLQHIPVIGKYVAIPNQILGKAVHEVTSFLGF